VSSPSELTVSEGRGAAGSEGLGAQPAACGKSAQATQAAQAGPRSNNSPAVRLLDPSFAQPMAARVAVSAASTPASIHPDVGARHQFAREGLGYQPCAGDYH
jgi:hypothetical protein